MKIAPLLWEIDRRPSIRPTWSTRGSTMIEEMSTLFFDQLHIPRPDINLEVGSGSHAVQTAEVMKRFEPIVKEQSPGCGRRRRGRELDFRLRPDGGQTRHTGGPRRVGTTQLRPVHARGDQPRPDRRDQPMAVRDRTKRPEQPEERGVPDERIFFVGNVMIDTLLACRERSDESADIGAAGFVGRGLCRPDAAPASERG